jgi:hypothetical protein
VSLSARASAFSEGDARAEVHRQRRVIEPLWRAELGYWGNVTNGTYIGDALLYMDGMSGRSYRRFINQLMRLHGADARYLEIGSWKGSTLASAIEGNKGHACCIDNWSEYGCPREAFAANIAATRTDATLEVIEADFREVQYRNIKGGPFNIYMFDGPHNEQDHYDGIRRAQHALADTYTLIVDDWNWLGVRTGTLKALIDAGLCVEHAMEIRTTKDNSGPPERRGGASDWHNGYFIAQICKKPTRIG